MAEEFDPNAFRQHMTQGAGQGAGQVAAPIPTPIPAPITPQHPATPMQGQPQPYVPQQAPQPQYTPQPAPQPAPQSAPQQYAPPQPAQFQAPHYQGQQHGQSQAYHPPQAQPQFRPQAQPAYDQQISQHGQPIMQPEIQQPKVKKSLFKRKKLKAAAQQMTPQLGGARDMVPDASKSGLSRLIVFLGGLAVGVLGTLVAIMVFSGNEPQRANMAMTDAALEDTALGQAQIETATGLSSSQMALTDEMLMQSQTEDQGGQP